MPMLSHTLRVCQLIRFVQTIAHAECTAVLNKFEPFVRDSRYALARSVSVKFELLQTNAILSTTAFSG